MRHVVALASIPVIVIGSAVVANAAGIDEPAKTTIIVVAMIVAVMTARVIDLSGPARNGRDRPVVESLQVGPAVSAPLAGPRAPDRRQGLALLAIPTIIVGATLVGRLAGIEGNAITVVALIVAVVTARAIDSPTRRPSMQ